MPPDPWKDAVSRIARHLKDRGVTGNIPLRELMPPSFIREHTAYTDIDAMVLAAAGSPEAVASEADLKRFCTSEEWDQFVAANSPFGGFEDMLRVAGDGHVRRKLQ